MATAEIYSGTEAIGTTEWSLTTDTAGPDADTTPGPITCVLDLNDMVAGDVLELKCYEKVRSGDTQRLAAKWTFSNAQSEPIFISPPMPLLHGWDFTLDATSGTITVNWSLRGPA